jgi:hypothetical protein
MFSLNTAGWFQCRLATNPDAFDDLRGHGGWTFAVSDEPDLDRIIRFQSPVAPRSHGPTVGVFVTQVTVEGSAVLRHPLIGAPVALLGTGRIRAGSAYVHRAFVPPISERNFHRDFLSLDRRSVIEPVVCLELNPGGCQQIQGGCWRELSIRPCQQFIADQARIRLRDLLAR